MNKLAFVQSQKNKIVALSRQYGVRSIQLFGSVAKGEDDDESDIDFLVELEPGRSLFDLGGFQIDLEQMLDCPVDVITPQGLRRRIQSRVLKEAIAL